MKLKYVIRDARVLSNKLSELSAVVGAMRSDWLSAQEWLTRRTAELASDAQYQESALGRVQTGALEGFTDEELQEELDRRAPPGETFVAVVRLNSNRDELQHDGYLHGLTGEALANFALSFGVVELECLVSKSTGTVRVVDVRLDSDRCVA